MLVGHIIKDKQKKSQLLNAEVEAFLANGGVVQEMDSGITAAQLKQRNYWRHPTNVELSNFCRKSEFRFKELARVAKCSEEYLRRACEGFVMVSKKEFDTRYKPHMQKIRKAEEYEIRKKERAKERERKAKDREQALMEHEMRIEQKWENKRLRLVARKAKELEKAKAKILESEKTKKQD